MFYAHFVLSKRGPLARIWLAAHWDKKLTKAHVFETNLEDSVETIISPQVKMALRTSGHLLLGVVRIYNRKAKYLLADCNEAFVKIKMAFRPGVVDLPEENREAQHNQIYLPEEFHNFNTPLPDISDFDISKQLTLNQSRIDEITMPEEVPTTVQLDEGFGGGMMEFGKDVEDRYSAGDLQNMFYKDDNEDGKTSNKNFGFEMDQNGMKEGFAADVGDEGILGGSFMQGPGLFGEQQHGGLFGERSPKKPEEAHVLDNAEGAMDNQVMSPAVQQPLQIDEEATKENEALAEIQAVQIPEPQMMEIDEPHAHLMPANDQVVIPQDIPLPPERAPEPAEETAKDQTTLVENEAEAFALEPLDITGVKDMRIRRKRKLIVDHVMELDGQTMREQLKDFNDIVTTLDMAPPTKRLMQWKEMGGVDKLFSLPTKKAGDDMDKLFVTNLHNEIPTDLIDVTNTQLQEQYGETEADKSSDPSIQIMRHEEDVSIPVMNEADETRVEASFPSMIDQTDSVLLQGKDPSMNQLNVPANYQSDDDYEPASVGPPSVGSSIGGNAEPPVLSNENPILSTFDPDMSGLVDPALPPSPGEGEAFADDFDDLRWNKRTQHLLHSLQRSFKHEREISFFQMTDGISKKQAVSKFYSLLVLAKQEATLLQQSQIFGDVFIRKGPKFESILM